MIILLPSLSVSASSGSIPGPRCETGDAPGETLFITYQSIHLLVCFWAETGEPRGIPH